MNATWIGVYVCGNDRKSVIMRFKLASIADIQLHLANLSDHMREDGYILESFELKGDDDGYLTEDWL